MDHDTSPASDEGDVDPASLLAGLAARPIEDHPEVFAAIDDALTGELDDLDDLD